MKGRDAEQSRRRCYQREHSWETIRAQRALLGLEVTENRPALVGGRPGVEFHTKDRLAVRQKFYSTIVGARLFVLSYSAPARFFFDRDLAEFEAAARSFRAR